MLLGRDEDLAAEVATLLLRSELILPVGTSGTSLDHCALQLVDVEGATEAGLTVSDDRDEPVVYGGIALDACDLVCTAQSVVDATDNVRYGVSRVQGLVRVGVAGEVSVTSDLPTGEVDGLQACADLLNSLVTGEGAESVDVGAVALGDAVPEDLCAAACEGLLLDNGALQNLYLLCGVVAGNALPARVLVPVLLDFLCGTSLSCGGHVVPFLTGSKLEASTQLRVLACAVAQRCRHGELSHALGVHVQYPYL